MDNFKHLNVKKIYYFIMKVRYFIENIRGNIKKKVKIIFKCFLKTQLVCNCLHMFHMDTFISTHIFTITDTYIYINDTSKSSISKFFNFLGREGIICPHQNVLPWGRKIYQAFRHKCFFYKSVWLLCCHKDQICSRSHTFSSAIKRGMN